MDSKYLKHVNGTCRAAGAVGKRAIVPRWVTENISKGASVLDFGAGVKAIHTVALREAGFTKVSPWDVGVNFVEGLHDPAGPLHQYDVVMASNVINVQPDEKDVERVIRELHRAVAEGGLLVANYPADPRHADLTLTEVQAMLERFFDSVERSSDYSSPLFICRHPSITD